MADRIISAEVRINGQDVGVAEMLAKVATNIKKVDEVAAQSGQMQKLGRQMVELKTQMEAVGKLQAVQTNLGAMQTRAAEAAARIEKLKTEMAGVAKPTEAMARAMTTAEVASVKAAAAVVRQTEAVERNRKVLADMGLSTANAVREQERLARSFQDTARAAEIQMRAEQKAEHATTRLAHATHGAARGHGGGLDVGGAIAGALAGHSVISGAESVLEVYREFDKERRYGKVVMGITDEQQKPLVDQAVHGGATSKFNDIQWLESQRELAMRGYNKDQVLGFTPIVAQIGQAFDVSMPEAVKALEGAMLGFGKDVSTFDKASSAATRTADLEVKASKISGMGFEDIVSLYKYAAAPAKMAHLSEESMLAYGAISKKSNMGGDESGVAFRALAKNLIAPTAEARTAMLANGIDFSKYQTAPKDIDIGAFTRDVAVKYGVQLNEASKAGLARIFHDPKMLADPALFVPAVSASLKETLGKQDAKSSKAIAGDARKFRDDSVGSVDTNGLMAAIMQGISKSPQLANAIFGSKQGGRIYAALGDPKFFEHILSELHSESGGFAKKVSEDRMAGFDGAVSKFEGAVKNLESAFGRAFDNDGKGGFLAAATEGAAHFVQILAEADPHLLQIGAAAAGLTGLWGSAKVVGLFSGGFGLKGAAEQLDASAILLKEAAGAIAAGGHGGPAGPTPGVDAGPNSPEKPTVKVPEKPQGKGLFGGGRFSGLLPLFGTAGMQSWLYSEGKEAVHGFEDHVLGFTPADRDKIASIDPLTDLMRLMHGPAAKAAPTRVVPTYEEDRATRARDIGGPPRTYTLPADVGREAERGRGLMRPLPEAPLNREQTFRYMQGLGMVPGWATTEQQGPPAPYHPADDDRQTRARADDVPATSWWHRIFGAAADPAQQAGDKLAQLGDRSGVVLASFDGLNGGVGTLDTAFGTLGTGVGGAAHELDVLGLAARTAAVSFASLLSAAGGGGGNGIINASWGGGGGEGFSGNALAVGGGFGNAGWGKSGAARPEVADYIRAHAARLGIDPQVALRVAQSEGLNTYTGDYGTSFGAFQLHYGGSGIRGMNSGGLGDRFTRETGLDARDPTTWKAQVDYALKTAKREGWSAWHGAAHVGIGGRQGLDWHGKVPSADEHPALAAKPLPRRAPADHDGPSAHAVSAKLDRVTDKLERVASAVERGGLLRHELILPGGVKAKKVYQRGRVGSTIA